MLNEMFDEVTGRASWLMTLIMLVLVLAIVLGIVKVKNELQMTKAYDRQAAALERIAAAAERAAPEDQSLEAYLKKPISERMKIYHDWEKENGFKPLDLSRSLHDQLLERCIQLSASRGYAPEACK